MCAGRIQRTYDAVEGSEKCMKRENEYEKTGYKKETGSEEYQKNGKKQNEYCEQNIVDQILQMSEDTEVLNRLKPENIAKLLEICHNS